MISNQKSSYSKFLLISLLVAGVFGAYLLFFLFKQPATPLPILGQVSSFQLTDSRDLPFTEQDLKGKVWIADFIFTTCAGPCPIMTHSMASLYRSFLLVPDIDFVSFSVNPEYDTPKVLSEYAKRYDANPEKWHFLTGPSSAIKKLLTEDFKLGSTENPIFHAIHFVLVDKNLRIRGYYEGTQKEALKKLFKDAARLVKEKE